MRNVHHATVWACARCAQRINTSLLVTRTTWPRVHGRPALCVPGVMFATFGQAYDNDDNEHDV